VCIAHNSSLLRCGGVRVRGRDWRSRLVRVRCDGRAASSGAAAEVERLLSAPQCGLASGLVAIAKFVCDTVCYCSRRLHTKRETQERLVEKDFSFFIFFLMKDFSFLLKNVQKVKCSFGSKTCSGHYFFSIKRETFYYSSVELI